MCVCKKIVGGVTQEEKYVLTCNILFTFNLIEIVGNPLSGNRLISEAIDISFKEIFG